MSAGCTIGFAYDFAAVLAAKTREVTEKKIRIVQAKPDRACASATYEMEAVLILSQNIVEKIKVMVDNFTIELNRAN